MKKTLIYIFVVSSVIAGNSCTKKILEKVDVNGLSAQQVWTSAVQANLYLNSLYNVIMPVWPANQSANTFPNPLHNISDECNGGTTALIQGKLTNDQVTDFYSSTSSGTYPYLRRINMLFANIDNYGLTPDVTAPIKAQAYFLRAYVYFDLLKIYGGIPYITKPQDWITDSLNVPRNSSSQCIDSLIADLNHCSILPGSWPQAADFGRITRGAALAFKARVLLTWASPQFNPNNDASRWQLALTACKNAYDTCTMDGYALYSKFSNIFIDASSGADKEPIIFRPFNGANVTGQFEGYDGVARPFSQSSGSGGASYNPTWNLVTAFPMKDGYPITAASGAVPYDSVYYWHNRDPRFYATIVYNGAFYGLSSTPDRKQWMYTGITVDKTHPNQTGFYSRKNIDTTVTAANSQYGKTFWVELRYAEVLLNLAEAANATGDQATAYTMLGLIRARAGIPKGTDPTHTYGISTNLSQADLETAIITEREIEFAFEGKRYDDLRRTRTFDKLNGQTRNAMIVAFKSTYKVSTMETINPATGHAPVDTINVDGPDYTKYFTHTIIPITGELPINFPTTYYAYGIPSTNISKDPSMVQTIGWLFGTAAGTFDPTK